MSISPVISYPGAKFKAWHLIEPLIPTEIEDWREPFMGGMSTSLRMAESTRFNLKRMQVGDIAPEIWAFWQGCKLHAPEAADIAKRWFTEKCPTQLKLQDKYPGEADYQKVYDAAILEGRALWKWAQEVDCTQLSLAERCARTFLVNKISFSGMGDSGSISKDQFTDFRLDKTDKLTEVQPLLSRIDIRLCGFEETMADVDPLKTFIFLDPPYMNQEGSGLYGRGGDTHKGFPHREFARVTKDLKCRWLMTYDDSVGVRKLYRGCEIQPFYIPYTMAGKTAVDALAGEEIFIANYPIKEETSFSGISTLL